MKFSINGYEMKHILLFVLGASLATGYVFGSMPFANAATTSTTATTSNVTVNSYVAISLTTTFAGGIEFGAVEMDTYNNATTCNGLGCNITVSADTNVGVDIMVKDNDHLRVTGAATKFIYNGNYTWASSDATNPVSNATTYVLNVTAGSYDNTNLVGTNVAAGAKKGWQAWLTIPSAQSGGTYNNSISFCGQKTATKDCL